MAWINLYLNIPRSGIVIENTTDYIKDGLDQSLYLNIPRSGIVIENTTDYIKDGYDQSLYLNVPDNEGIQAVLNMLYYNNKDSHLIPIPTGTMKDLLNIVVTQNYFQFSHEILHQIQGTAMGTKMAPAYANIYMAELENKFRQLPNTTTYGEDTLMMCSVYGLGIKKT